MIAVMPEYLTVAEAAKELGLSARAIHKRIAEGVMRAERFGALVWMIPTDEVDRWRGRGKLKPGPKRQTKE
jgi:excisionase family DNA binding protein